MDSDYTLDLPPYAAFAKFVIMFKSMAISNVGCGEMIEIKAEPIFQTI
jgi:hypothetical protein